MSRSPKSRVAITQDTTYKWILRRISIILGVILLLSFTSWCIVRIMATYCYPSGYLGPFITLFVMGNPVCHTLNTIQLKLVDNYIAVFKSLITIDILQLEQILTYFVG